MSDLLGRAVAVSVLVRWLKVELIGAIFLSGIKTSGFSKDLFGQINTSEPNPGEYHGMVSTVYWCRFW
jgi:hypothetical protein